MGKSFGLAENNTNTVDMHPVKQRKVDMVEGLQQVHRANFEKSGAELIWGDGRFVGPKTIEVTDEAGSTRMLTAEHVVVCTGSRASISDIPGLKEANPMSHIDILDLEVLPEHLIIIGGGYIGLEFAQAMRRFGAKVTVIDHNERVLKKEDEDVAVTLREILEKEHVAFSTSTSITKVSGHSGEGVTLDCDIAGNSTQIKGSHILCATGRTPNNYGIGLELAGIEVTKTGHIQVDEHNQTSADRVFAVGDCAGSPHFTHIAFDDFRIVRDTIVGKELPAARRSGRQVPFTLFTDPEFAHIGLREHEAKKQGIQYRLAKLPMAAFLRTRTIGETAGFAKALISEDDMILGFTAVGAGVGELLPVVQLAMRNELPYTSISELVVTHPTLSEGLVYLFMAVPKK